MRAVAEVLRDVERTLRDSRLEPGAREAAAWLVLSGRASLADCVRAQELFRADHPESFMPVEQWPFYLDASVWRVHRADRRRLHAIQVGNGWTAPKVRPANDNERSGRQ